MAGHHEEEALGKAYDSRLAKRLSGYLRPYKWRVAASVCISLTTAAFSLVQPLLVLRAIDHSIPPCPREHFEYFLNLVRSLF